MILLSANKWLPKEEMKPQVVIKSIPEVSGYYIEIFILRSSTPVFTFKELGEFKQNVKT